MVPVGSAPWVYRSIGGGVGLTKLGPTAQPVREMSSITITPQTQVYEQPAAMSIFNSDLVVCRSRNMGLSYGSSSVPDAVFISLFCHGDFSAINTSTN